MKSRIVSFLFFLFFVLVQQLQAQNIYYLNKQIVDALDHIARLKNMDTQASTIEGSPYYHDEFIKGDIYYDVNWRYPEVPLRFNIFNDEMEIKPEGQEKIYAIDPEKRVQKITIREDTFFVADYELKRKVVPGFFKELVHGKVDLLAKPHVNFKEKEVAKGFVEPSPDRFIRMPDQYYVRKNGEMAEKLPSLKKLIELMGDHQNELEKYTKENNISVGNLDELIQFISYYNSLD
jgi:hypothetical protein